MVKKNSLKRSIQQVIAITEKNLFLELHVKPRIAMRFLNPIIELFIFLFLFGAIFNTGSQLGYWNNTNYILFILIAFNIQFSRSIISRFNKLFLEEKYWKTLSATMVAPINRFTLLIGVLISELLIISLPITLIFILIYILYPISLFSLSLFLLIFFLIYLVFGSLGLIISVYAMSHEEILPYANIILRFIFLFSCTSYPLQIFPQFIQFICLLNPFYYIFDLLRLVWYIEIDYSVASSIISPAHIISIVLIVILTPIISIYIFERIYKKHGITGY